MKIVITALKGIIPDFLLSANTRTIMSVNSFYPVDKYTRPQVIGPVAVDEYTRPAPLSAFRCFSFGSKSSLVRFIHTSVSVDD